MNRDKGEIIDINNGKIVEKFGRNHLIRSPTSQNENLSSIKESPEPKEKHRNVSEPAIKGENHPYTN